jgi:hypothetical protein
VSRAIFWNALVPAFALSGTLKATLKAASSDSAPRRFEARASMEARVWLFGLLQANWRCSQF